MISRHIELRFGSVETVFINKREAFRYLGIASKRTNEDFEKLFDECLDIFNRVVTYKACFSPIEIEHFDNDLISLGFSSVESKSLKKNLDGMKKGFVFAATLGTAVDRTIMKYSKLEPSKAMVIDAIASSAIEGFCNLINDELKSGFFSRFRFSPGYGDLSLEIQPKILEYLDAYRKIGISLSYNLIMTPMKSVTAIFGVKEKE